MASRRQARQWAMQLLFQIDLNPQEPEKALDEFWADKKAKQSSREFVNESIIGVMTNLKDIDAVIQGHAENWDIKRMHRVDRSLLRLAIFEMLYRKDIPPVVSINEAVELAKEFGGSSSGKFINGILDRIRSELDRPSRD